MLKFLKSALVLALFAGGLAQASPPTGYTLTWSDEFNGSCTGPCDTDAWTYDDEHRNKDAGCNVDAGTNVDHVVETGGSLVLRAKKQTAASCSNRNWFSDARTTQYWVGAVSSQLSGANGNWCAPSGACDRTGFGPGVYLEVQATVYAAADGVWPAIWLLGRIPNEEPAFSNGDRGWSDAGEIDLWESLSWEWNDSTCRSHHTLHREKDADGDDNTTDDLISWGHNQGNERAMGLTYDLVTCPSSEGESRTVTLGLLWKENQIIMYVDGQQVKTFDPGGGDLVESLDHGWTNYVSTDGRDYGVTSDPLTWPYQQTMNNQFELIFAPQVSGLSTYAEGSQWAGFVDEAGWYDTRLDIHYVRLYEPETAVPSVSYELVQCDNIPYKCNVEAYADCCGADMSNALSGDLLTTTGFNGRITTDKTGGTIYSCVFLASDPNPTADDIKNNTGSCIQAKSRTSFSAGDVDFDSGNSANFTGLTPGERYQVTYWQDRGDARPHVEVLRSAAFRTLTSVVDDLPPIEVSGHHLATGSTPFVWVGDTAWYGQTLTDLEIDDYLETRAAQGYTVIQGPILADQDGSYPPTERTLTEMRQDSDGDRPFTAADSTSVTLNESYWTKIDKWVTKAESEGLYICLAPSWGPAVDDWFGDEATLVDYYEKVATRYVGYDHVCYIVAGEYHKITWTPADSTGVDPLDATELSMLNAMGQALRDNAHADSLITIHPTAARSASEDFHTQTWLDFVMIQTYANWEKNISKPLADFALSPTIPTIQAEMAYEASTAAVFNDADVRNAAYGSIMAGSVGYTYGHNDVWQFATGWDTDIDTAAGGLDMPHLATLLNDYHSVDRIPNQALLVSGPTDTTNQDFVQVSSGGTGDGQYILAYSSEGDTFSLDTSDLSYANYRARWFDPRLGTYSASIGTYTPSASESFDPPGSPAVGNDYVLVVDFVDGGGDPPDSGGDVTGLGYFVDCDAGNDSNDGLTVTTPWRTLGEANNSVVSIGANLYIKGTCADQTLTVDWGGTASDPAVVTSYYLEAGVPKAWAAGQEKAVIDGTYELATCRNTHPTTCDWGLTTATSGSSVPRNHYAPLLDVDSEHVEVRGLALHDSAGAAIHVDEKTIGAPSKARIEYNDIRGTMSNAIAILNAKNDSEAYIGYNTVEWCSLAKVDGRHTNWAPCVLIASRDATVRTKAIVEHNSITHNGGEGYNVNRSGGVILRYNSIHRGRNVLFYTDVAQDVVYEHNFATGEPFIKINGSSVPRPTPFLVAVECYPQSANSENVVFRKNLLVNVSTISFTLESPNGCPSNAQGRNIPAEGFQISAMMDGNTIIYSDDTTEALATHNATVNDNIEYLIVKNNVFVNATDCDVENIANSTFLNNAWESNPSGTNCDGTGDQYGTIGLSNDSSWDYDNIPSTSAFTLPSGSVALNNGTATDHSKVDRTKFGDFDTGDCVLTQAQWEEDGFSDYFCTTRADPARNIGYWEGNP